MSKTSKKQFKEQFKKTLSKIYSGKVDVRRLKSDKDILKATDKELKQQFKDDKNIDVDLKQENK